MSDEQETTGVDDPEWLDAKVCELSRRLDARDAEIKRLRDALEDAIRSPKGVMPDSVVLIRQAEERDDG